ncbi:tannase/feruloyl esterase family alpha/beta hydrolase [Actinomadura alba]|uniref:Tannase/feruloyl esterase family alpha/beta hydrolase n=1 Tax=Actinomadura alba TaxID=406431 RepID=A0ABR7LKV9_9ACTN|nr:tannase/feruloyl esterase family alpha/beta hydrolase [Actinomadura alba]MBC6465117.1 tannase/feruloyl esterase family alpha/beta hydrolase [Actinomadura alba]
MPSLRRTLAVAAALAIGTSPLVAASATAGTSGSTVHGSGGHCARIDRITVPGAEKQVSACLDDLTTAGTTATGHTVPGDWAGLHPAGAKNPSGVPGVQLDGYFPDTSTFNTNNGWNHDAQFVIRLPDNWNGGLVVAGSPGTRRQYANDFTISDWALAKGYAFASTDKGNSGAAFYRDGTRPGDALVEWNDRVTQLTVAAKALVAQRYGRTPKKTYAAGISNGGYLVRWQLENRPWLYDGGIDSEGTLWRADGPNLLTYLPDALAAYPRYAATGDPAAHAELLKAGFAPGSEFLWDYHHKVYWDLTQRIYREELDPTFDGATEAGTPFCAPGTPACDADYDYASRPKEVRRAVERIALTGKIRKPLITLHGTFDTLLPIGTDSDLYAKMIKQRGGAKQHRYYRIEAGNHVDGLYDIYPDRLRPILPCMRSAFTALETWTAGGRTPPPSATLPRPTSGDLANTCSLTG